MLKQEEIEYLQLRNFRCPNCSMRFCKPFVLTKKCQSCGEKLPEKLRTKKVYVDICEERFLEDYKL